jgi:hypothetical protein
VIITYSKHGRSARDSANLIAHLLNPENEVVEILTIENSVATDLPGVVKDMEILRDGCGALAAFHHMSINPSIDLTPQQLVRAAKALCEELDPAGTRPLIVIAHIKPRENGVGILHGHLLLGHSDGQKSLRDGRSKIRTEVVARALELEFGEKPVRSRHATYVDKLLRQRGKENVADWLITTLGNEQESPKSSYGSKSRQATKRKGVQLPKAKSAVVTAFVAAGNLLEFKTKLAALGFQIEPGTKKNVWMIVDGSGNSIGAIDRLLKLKRHVANAMMEGRDGTFQDAKQSAANDRRTREASARGDQTLVRSDREIKGGPSSAGRAHGKGSRRGNHKLVAEPRDPRRAPDVGITKHQRENGRRHRGVGHRRALIILRGVGSCIQKFNAEPLPQLPIHWDLKDIWGIPIPLPQYPHP